MYEYNAIVERVVDGDTVDVSIDLGFHIRIHKRVILDGIDTPETRTLNPREKVFGERAKARVEELLPVGQEFRVVSKSYSSTDMYGRSNMDFGLGDGRTICSALLKEKLAVPYHGQNKALLRAAHEANWALLDAQ